MESTEDEIFQMRKKLIISLKPILSQVKLIKLKKAEEEFNRKEDSVFCYRVFSLPNIKHVYIQNELSYYKASNTIF